MTRSLLADAFDHHVWATLRLIDTCLSLDPTQLETVVPGTYGSILSTMRHIVGADASYLFVLTDGHVQPIEEEGMDLPELRAAMVGFGTAWAELLAQPLDPDEIRVRHRDDGSEFYAPLGIRLAQVPHHGTDHRSQICTALTAIGIEPPLIDVWDFGEAKDRVKEVLAPT